MGPFGTDPSDYPSFYDPHHGEPPECEECDAGRATCDRCDGTQQVAGVPCHNCDDGTVTCDCVWTEGF